jgi:hypothetical protein
MALAPHAFDRRDRASYTLADKGCGMKKGIPWPFKVATKLAFGALRVNYQALKKRGLVEHGKMEQQDFARSVYRRHVTEVMQGSRARGCLLELGPGDSVATGFLARAAGFDSAWLVDAGPFATMEPAHLDQLASALAPGLARFDPATTPAQCQQQLADLGIHYETAGVQSLALVPDASVQHSFSNTVLQHVHRAEVPRLAAELGRAHAPGSLSSHLIKFSDHFSGGFLNKRLPDRVMESGLVKRANLYTNRLGADELGYWFKEAGLHIVHVALDFADETLASRQVTDLAQLREAASRQILRAMYLLRKA